MGRRLCIGLVFVLWIFTNVSFALDRCQDYIPDVRQQHIRYFGLNYPWWYGVGQLKQESGCRDHITAFDLGQGAAQFMPATVKEVNRLMGEKLDPYKRPDAMRMQAFYMSRIHKQNWNGALWITYQGYNGGFTLLKKERDRAGKTDWSAMKACCKRKILTLKSGKKLDLCDVNYDYAKKVYKYGSYYRRSEDMIQFF